jgi:hypothetical protein
MHTAQAVACVAPADPLRALCLAGQTVPGFRQQSWFVDSTRTSPVWTHLTRTRAQPNRFESQPPRVYRTERVSRRVSNMRLWQHGCLSPTQACSSPSTSSRRNGSIRHRNGRNFSVSAEFYSTTQMMEFSRDVRKTSFEEGLSSKSRLLVGNNCGYGRRLRRSAASFTCFCDEFS